MAFATAFAEQLAFALHGCDPYDGFPHRDYQLEIQGWGSRSPMFAELIEAVRPQRIVEVGSWKGASAAYMCELMAAANIPGAIVCVDTWLDGDSIWRLSPACSSEERRRLYRYGRPVELYHQFLANMVHLGFNDRVVPFPTTSAKAARWLVRNQVIADLIYVDGSHDERDVYYDLVDYWPLVAAGGVLCGDDWSPQKPGVEPAVRRFAAQQNLIIELRDERKWFVRTAP